MGEDAEETHAKAQKPKRVMERRQEERAQPFVTEQLHVPGTVTATLVHYSVKASQHSCPVGLLKNSSLKEINLPKLLQLSKRRGSGQSWREGFPAAFPALRSAAQKVKNSQVLLKHEAKGRGEKHTWLLEDRIGSCLGDC